MNEQKSVITPSMMGIKSSTINRVTISNMGWKDFSTNIPQHQQYYAHVFWNVKYIYTFPHFDNKNRIRVLPQATISKKSWHREENASERLLRHQYGHYLIGCICALQFQDRVEKRGKEKAFSSKKEAIQWCYAIFNQTLKEHLEMEIKYDEETNHYYNQKEQAEWQEKIAKAINSYFKPSRRMNISKNERGSSETRNTSVESNKQNRENSINKNMKKDLVVKINQKVPIRSNENIPYIPLPSKKVLRKGLQCVKNVDFEERVVKNEEKERRSNSYRIKKRKGSLQLKRIEINME